MARSSITVLGQLRIQDEQERFGIKKDDRRHHVHIIGQTGMGKTNLLEASAIQDIWAGESLVVLDPHGGLVEKVILFVPRHRVEDVMYFNLTDTDFPIAFNPFENSAATDYNLISSCIIDVCKKNWPEIWTPSLTKVLKDCVHRLLRISDCTLLDLLPLLFEQQKTASLAGKLNELFSNTFIRNIVGQRRSSFDFSDILTRRKIMLINLKANSIGKNATILLGGLLLAKIHSAALKLSCNTSLPIENTYVYIDGLQHVITEQFYDILFEARMSRLCFTFAHRNLEQLEAHVHHAIFGLVGTTIIFNPKASDIKHLLQIAPDINEQDLQSLPRQHFYTKLMIDGICTKAFQAQNLSPFPDEFITGIFDEIIQFSRKRYARSSKVVESEFEQRKYSLAEEGHANKDSLETSTSIYQTQSTQFLSQHSPNFSPMDVPASLEKFSRKSEHLLTNFTIKKSRRNEKDFGGYEWQIGDSFMLGYFGPCRIFGRAQGGMGCVYFVLDYQGGRRAMKSLPKEFSSDIKRQESFFSEAIRWLELESHPNVVRVCSVDIINNVPRIFLEYVPDGCLRQYIGISELTQLYSQALQIALGMEHIHCQGLIHRDLKPENILVDKNLGIVKITDFGLAQAREQTKGRSSGTPAYMPPEQFVGKAQKQSDIYSFGLILYEMCSGRHPFRKKDDGKISWQEWQKRHQHEKVTPLVEHPLGETVQRCLQKHPADRPASFGEISDILRKNAPTKIELPLVFYDVSRKQKADIQVAIASSYYNLHKFSKALQAYQKAIEFDTENANAHLGYAVLCGQIGNFEDALEHCQIVLSLNPNHSIAYYNRGLIHTMMGKTQSAADDYNHCLQNDRQYFPAYCLRGLLHYQNNKPKEGQADFEYVLTWNAEYILYFFQKLFANLNKIAKLAGISQQQIETYRQTLEEIQKILHNKTAIEKKLLDPICDILQALDNKNISQLCCSNLQNLALETRDVSIWAQQEQTLATYLRSFRINKQTKNAKEQLSNLEEIAGQLKDMGRLRTSLSAYKGILNTIEQRQYSSDSAGILEYIGSEFIELNGQQEALRSFRKAMQLRLQEKDDKSKLERLKEIGYKFAKLGNFQDALKSLSHAFSINIELLNHQKFDIEMIMFLEEIAFMVDLLNRQPKENIPPKVLSIKTSNIIELLYLYLQARFPDQKLEKYSNHIKVVFANIDFSKFATIEDIDEILSKTKEARKHFQGPALSHLAIALACADSNYKDKTNLSDEALKIIDTHSSCPENADKYSGPYQEAREYYQKVFATIAQQNELPGKKIARKLEATNYKLRLWQRWPEGLEQWTNCCSRKNCCSYCGKNKNETDFLFQGINRSYICDQCAQIAEVDILKANLQQHLSSVGEQQFPEQLCPFCNIVHQNIISNRRDIKICINCLRRCNRLQDLSNFSTKPLSNRKIKVKINEKLVKNLEHIAWRLNQAGWYQSSAKANWKALGIREELENYSQQAWNWNAMGYNLYLQLRLSPAMEAYHKALEINKQLNNNLEQALSYHSLAVLHMELGNNQLAQQYLADSIPLLENTQPQSIPLAMIYNSQGWLQMQVQKKQSALNFYEKALKIREKLQNRFRLFYSYLRIGELYAKLGNQQEFPLALKFLGKARDIIEPLQAQNPDKIAYLEDLADTYQNLGYLYLREGETHQALEFFTKAKDIYLDIRERTSEITIFTKGIAKIYRRTGDVYKQLENFHKAEQWYTQSQKTSEEILTHGINSALCYSELIICTDRLISLHRIQENFEQADYQRQKCYHALKEMKRMNMYLYPEQEQIWKLVKD